MYAVIIIISLTKFWLYFEDIEVKNEKKTWSLTSNIHAYKSRLSRGRPDAEGQLPSYFIPDHSRIKLGSLSELKVPFATGSCTSLWMSQCIGTR